MTLDKGRAKKKRKLTTPSPSPPPPPLPPTEYTKVTNPKCVTGPVPEHINDPMKGAWKVNKKNSMALIFDVVNPATHSKWDELYEHEDEEPFASYDSNPEDDLDVTEDDGEGKAKPYKAIPCW